MTLTDRDRKIVLVLVPIALLLVYWFLIFAPQRQEASKLGDQLSRVEADRDDAVSRAASLQGSRASYAQDYATVVRLGKAIPSTLDMPSLLVQLDSAADGTGIDFSKVMAGDRAEAPVTGATAPGSQPPVAAGGAQAQTGAGKPVEQANGAAAKSEQDSAASGASPSGDPGPTSPGSKAPGLDSVPLEFTFNGSFFDLADFFHRMKRFVRVANERIDVNGRLMTIDGLTFTSTDFPTIKADVKATVYLSPKSQGTTGGATPQGPATAPTAPTTSSSTTSPPAAPSGSNPQGNLR